MQLSRMRIRLVCLLVCRLNRLTATLYCNECRVLVETDTRIIRLITRVRVASMRPQVHRRAACALLAPLLATLRAPPGRADNDVLRPQITSKVGISIAIGPSEPQELIIGLYGQAAPQSVKLFEALCTGKLPGSSSYAATS